MTMQTGEDVPQIHPSKIRVGDVIGTRHHTHLRYTVKLISGPQTGPQQWTFSAATTTACRTQTLSQRTS